MLALFKQTFSRRAVVALCFLPIAAAANTGYIAASDGRIYTFDSAVGGTPMSFTSLIGGSINSVVINGATGYLAMDDGLIYTFNPTLGGGITPFTPPVGGTANGVAIDGSTGYIAAGNGLIYTFDPTLGGGITPFTASVGIANGVAIDGSTGYIAANNGLIYTFHPTLGGGVTPFTASVGIANGVAIDGSTGYIAANNGLIYTFNSTLGGGVTPFTASVGIANGVAIDSSTGYIAANNGLIYTFNPVLGGGVTPFTASVGVANGVAIRSSIPTTGLTGNSLLLADYLNANAPSNTIRLFNSSPNLARSLKSASPARNVASTFMAEIIQLAFIKTFSHHQRRNHPIGKRESFLASHQNPDDLLAWGKPYFQKKDPPSCKRFSPWLSLFGEYTRQNAQSQTPFFHAGSGGAVAALDYYGSCLEVMGWGAAYAYTQLDQSRGNGHATINQGALTAYGTWASSNGYCDLALWGGFYDTHNVRNVTVSSVSGQASSHTHGWQFTPHLETGFVHSPLNSPRVTVAPFISADWVNCWEDGFREQGLDGLNMGQANRYCSLLRAEGGVRFEETKTVGWGSIFFREKASYLYQQSFRTDAIRAFLIGSPGSFTFSTFTGVQQMGALELEVFFEPCNHNYPYSSVAYQGEFSWDYQSQQAIFSLGMDY